MRDIAVSVEEGIHTVLVKVAWKGSCSARLDQMCVRSPNPVVRLRPSCSVLKHAGEGTNTDEATCR